LGFGVGGLGLGGLAPPPTPQSPIPNPQSPIPNLDIFLLKIFKYTFILIENLFIKMESQKTKEDRRRKFLSKMGEKNKKKEKELNKIKESFNQLVGSNMNSLSNNNNKNPAIIRELNPIRNNINSDTNKLKEFPDNNYLNNNINNQTKNDFNFIDIIEKTNTYDYMMNFQNIAKRILIIILSILHTINFPFLNNTFVFKYTFIVLELSSFYFNRYYYSQKASLRQKMMNPNGNNGQQNQFEKVAQILLDYFGFFSFFFVVFKVIKDIILDISILLIINVIYFIIMNKD
jgi:hypothetical protein